MSNFRLVDRGTDFLLQPSVDEWLPERHLARFVVEIIEQLDLSGMSRAYRGSGSAAYQIQQPNLIKLVTACEVVAVFEALAHNPDSKAINATVRALETQCAEMRAEFEQLKARAAQSESRLLSRRAERLSKALTGTDKAAPNAALRECFRQVVVDYGQGTLRLKWHHTDQDLTLVYDLEFSALAESA